jgi:hypothetical protein
MGIPNALKGDFNWSKKGFSLKSSITIISTRCGCADAIESIATKVSAARLNVGITTLKVIIGAATNPRNGVEDQRI